MHILIRLWDEDYKKFDIRSSILHFLMELLQPIFKKASCQESKNLTKITFYKSPQMDLNLLELMTKQRNWRAFTTYGHWNLWTAYSPQQSKSRNQIISVDCRESHESYMEITYWIPGLKGEICSSCTNQFVPIAILWT